MAARQYQYVGPDDIREAALPSSPAGTPIRSADDLLAWIAGRSSDTEPDGSLIFRCRDAVDACGSVFTSLLISFKKPVEVHHVS